MKKCIIFLCTALILLTGACVPEKMDNGGDSFIAALETSAVCKTTVSSGLADRSVAWSLDDRAVIGGMTYQVKTVKDNGQAVFIGMNAVKEEGVYKAWYPEVVYNDGTPALPAVQHWEDGSTGHLPMYAQSASKELEFKNLCALMSLRLKGPETVLVGSVVVQSIQSAPKCLSGPFSLDWNGGNPVMTMTGNPSSGDDTVTLDLGTGVQLNPSTPVELFIAIPPQPYDTGGLKITIYSLSNEVLEEYTSLKYLEAERRTYYPIVKDQVGI